MQKNLLVLVVDRLGAGYLGPYGATWLDTPAFNRLASQSLLVEHVLADAAELATLYRAFWTGRHAVADAIPSPSLASLAAARGYRTCLLTDDWTFAEHPLACEYEEQVRVKVRNWERPAKTIAATQIAEIFAATSDWLREADAPFLLWVHARGANGPWDAPWELRSRWSDEDDPTPPTFLAPPERKLSATPDPDEVLGMVHAYAAQVAALDECLESFLSEFLNSPRSRDTLLVLTSPRGYPLGEHGIVGAEGRLYGELLRLPLFLRYPCGQGAGHRSQAISQPANLFTTLANWLDLAVEPNVPAPGLERLAAGDNGLFDRALAVNGAERAFRTPAWFVRQRFANRGEPNSTETIELFVKPDDQWEVNEISQRASQVIEELLSVADDFERALKANAIATIAPLSNLLRDGEG